MTMEVGEDYEKRSEAYLPSWVLKMRAKIHESRASHAETSDRIDGLHQAVGALGRQIAVLKPISIDNQLVDSANSADVVKPRAARFTFSLWLMPSDVLLQILKYLPLHTVCGLQRVSGEVMHAVTIGCDYYWQDMFVLCRCERAGEDDNRSILTMVITQARLSMQCLSFIRVMKAQRGTNRAPNNTRAKAGQTSSSQRGTRVLDGKSISHPLPLFDGTDVLGPTSNLTKLMMSHADTFSSDFSVIAHRALTCTQRITSNLVDPLHDQLLCEGAVTVLVALLCNESAAIQLLSCAVLANLICADSRSTRALRHGTIVTSVYPPEISPPPLPAALRTAQRRSVPQQMFACNGHRSLLELLTSPSATINLAVSRLRTYTSTSTSTKTTASVQGASTKEASRALISLFCPYLAVPPVKTHIEPIIEAGSVPHHTAVPDPMPLGLALERSARPWIFLYYHKSGGLKCKCIVYMHYSTAGTEVKGRGKDEVGYFTLHGKAELDIFGWVWYIHKVYVSQDVVMESGVVQWMQSCHVSEPEGDDDVGRDAIAASRLRSHMNLAAYWSPGATSSEASDSFTHPLLTPRSPFRQTSSGARAASGVVPSWRQPSIEPVADQNLVDDTDMVDVLLSTVLDPSPSHTHRSSDQPNISPSPGGGGGGSGRGSGGRGGGSVDVWGLGMWGVWETATTGSHFELQRGGVFRAVPVLLD